MTLPAFTFHAALTVLMAVVGLAGGLLYFGALKRSVVLFIGGQGWRGPLMLTLGRLGIAGVVLFCAAKAGAAPLMAAFVGFLLARALATRTARKPA